MLQKGELIGESIHVCSDIDWELVIGEKLQLGRYDIPSMERWLRYGSRVGSNICHDVTVSLAD